MVKVATKRVCLVQPSSENPYDSGRSIWPPLGLMSLAASLRQHGHEVSIIDGILEGFERDIQLSETTYLQGLPPDELAAMALACNPDVVGLSLLFFNQVGVARQVAEIIRKENPNILIILGGPIVTLNPEKYIALPNIDAVVLGDGDLSTPQLLANIAKAGFAAELPPGTGVRRSCGYQLDRGHLPIANLDALPYPARDLVDMNRYANMLERCKVLPKQRPASTMMSARGCPRHCTFCSAPTLYNRSYTMRSPENVIGEIDILVKEYGIREIVFLDENFAVNRRRVDRILDLLIERDYGISWYCASGIEIPTLTEEILEKMVSTGLYKIKFSFESANERVLKELIKKPINVAHGERLVRKAQELGLPVGANFVIGYPGETRAEIMESFEFAKRVGFDFTLWNLATPYPNTELTEQAKLAKLLPDNFDYSELKPGVPFFDSFDVQKEELAAMRYNFWHELHFLTPEKAAIYHRYAAPNPNYIAPKPGISGGAG